MSGFLWLPALLRRQPQPPTTSTRLHPCTSFSLTDFVTCDHSSLKYACPDFTSWDHMQAIKRMRSSERKLLLFGMRRPRQEPGCVVSSRDGTAVPGQLPQHAQHDRGPSSRRVSKEFAGVLLVLPWEVYLSHYQVLFWASQLKTTCKLINAVTSASMCRVVRCTLLHETQNDSVGCCWRRAMTKHTGRWKQRHLPGDLTEDILLQCLNTDPKNGST